MKSRLQELADMYEHARDQIDREKLWAEVQKELGQRPDFQYPKQGGFDMSKFVPPKHYRPDLDRNQWQVIENLEDIVRKAPPTSNPNMLDKQTFYEKAIRCGPNKEHRRLVMKRDLEKADMIIRESQQKGDDGYGITVQREPETNTTLFVPAGPEDDFNLVSSLCTDGLHRPVLDLDFGKDELEFHLTGGPYGNRAYVVHRGSRIEVKFPDGDLIVTDSTNNCHVWLQGGCLFSQYVELLGLVPGEDARKFATNVKNKGFGCLRAPWIKKEQ